MKINKRIEVRVLIGVCLCIMAGGCPEPYLSYEEPNDIAPEIDLGTTIGSVAEVFAVEAIPVEGLGLVGGLNGTGSSECPPQIKAYLKQYILKQLPTREVDVEELLRSNDTAVVSVEGIIPAVASRNQYFDVRVWALSGTQTTSLEGGQLYGTELKAGGKFGVTIKVLAEAEGPIFTDTLDEYPMDKRTGYVLAGGTVIDENEIKLILLYPDYKTSGLIRDRINSRFGEGTAKAVSPGQVEIEVPIEYREQKQRFISILKSMYLQEDPQVSVERVERLIGQLETSENKYASEVALEAIGSESLGKLTSLLNSPDEEIRMRAARCMLNLGSTEGLDTLREMALNIYSRYRLIALQAITAGASRNDAATISRRVLRDRDFNIRLAAYEQLRKLDDITLRQELIARDFYLEQILQTPHKSIYVSRSGQPRVVLFGAPLYCRQNIFVESSDGNITINAPAGQDYVSIIRRHPKQPNVIAQLKTTFDLSSIIRTLCEEPHKKDVRKQVGLGVSYAEMIALLQQMADKGAIEVEFSAGPLPKISPIIKK